MATIGGVGLGLVWGWWLVLVGRQWGKRPFPTFLVLVSPTLLLSLLLGWLHPWPTALAFLLAAAISFFTHLAWQQKLRQAQESEFRV